MLSPLLILTPSDLLRRRLKILLSRERRLALLNVQLLTFYQLSLRLQAESSGAAAGAAQRPVSRRSAAANYPDAPARRGALCRHRRARRRLRRALADAARSARRTRRSRGRARSAGRGPLQPARQRTHIAALGLTANLSTVLPPTEDYRPVRPEPLRHRTSSCIELLETIQADFLLRLLRSDADPVRFFLRRRAPLSDHALLSSSAPPNRVMKPGASPSVSMSAMSRDTTPSPTQESGISRPACPLQRACSMTTKNENTPTFRNTGSARSSILSASTMKSPRRRKRFSRLVDDWQDAIS